MTPEIAKYVRDKLYREGWTQGEFAKKIGTTRQYLNTLLNPHTDTGKKASMWKRILKEAGLELTVIETRKQVVNLPTEEKEEPRKISPSDYL